MTVISGAHDSENLRDKIPYDFNLPVKIGGIRNPEQDNELSYEDVKQNGVMLFLTMFMNWYHYNISLKEFISKYGKPEHLTCTIEQPSRLARA